MKDQKNQNKKWAQKLNALQKDEKIDDRKGMKLSEHMAFSGTLKDLKCKDPVGYQRKIRNEW